MTIMDDLNYAGDARNCAPATAPILYMDNGTEMPLPTKWAVCQVCDGKGSHANPAIDAGGISAEQFHDDPGFAESYTRGDYNQVCNSCQGRTTVQVVDWDRLNADECCQYQAQLQEEDNDRATHLAEIRMGA